MQTTQVKTPSCEDGRPDKRRFPPWIRKRTGTSAEAAHVRRLLADLGLATVCSSAHCPNQSECYARGTATFLILGSVCTRSCRFCAIRRANPGPLREDEPETVAEAAARLGLAHVVVTSVTRDDLGDGGAGHFARTIRAIRMRLPRAVIEVLTPDFQGSREALQIVLAARPDVFNHNVETVPRLYAAVRPEADYGRSLEVLRYAAERAPQEGLKIWTKSGLMVGLGETDGEIRGPGGPAPRRVRDRDDGSIPGAVAGARAGRAVCRAAAIRRVGSRGPRDGVPGRGRRTVRPVQLPGRARVSGGCGCAGRRVVIRRTKGFQQPGA